MPKKRSRARFSWKAEYGGVPAWGIAAAIGLLAVLVAAPAVVNAMTPAAAPYVRPTDAFDEPTPTPIPEIPVVAFLGDSYTGGSQMGGTEENGWPRIVAGNFGWIAEFSAEGGSGYLKAGPNVTAVPFGDRLEDVVAFQPDIVIVAGGINDAGSFATEEIVAAASGQLDQLRASLPEAQLIVVGPFYPTSPPPQEISSLRDGIAALAASRGLPFIDPLPWFEGGTVEIGADGTHPTDAGHAVIAQEITESLLNLGFAETP